MNASSTIQSGRSLDFRSRQENLRITEKELQHILNERGIDGVMQKMNEIDANWRKQPVLIAVIGQTGSGKSTLIRRFCGFAPDDPRDPLIGSSVGECTKESKEYPVPDTGLVYIDLPGVGSTTTTCAFTTQKEQDAYCQSFRLKTVDYFLLLSHDKFNGQEKHLADYITNRLKKKFIFVQTKVDELRRQHGNKRLEKEQGFPALKNKIRTDIQRQLVHMDLSRIFFISNEVVEIEHDGEKIEEYDQSPDYEFDQLFQQIQNDMLGENGLTSEKANAFFLATNAKCRSAIRAKADMLRKQSWFWSILSGAIGATPIPGTSMICDTNIILNKVQSYLKSFGLEPKHYLGEGSGEEKLKNLFDIMKASMGLRATSILISVVSANAIEEGIKFVPVPVIGLIIGSAVGAGVSFTSTFATLRLIIEFCEMKALEAIKRN